MFVSIAGRVLFNSFVDAFSSSALLPALCRDRRGNPLGHDNAAGALTAAQAFYEGADRGVRREAEASQHMPGQFGLMPAVQATDDQYFTSVTQHESTLSTRNFTPLLRGAKP
jgi:hypothetical protein